MQIFRKEKMSIINAIFFLITLKIMEGQRLCGFRLAQEIHDVCNAIDCRYVNADNFDSENVDTSMIINFP